MICGSTAIDLSVSIPFTVSTRNAWFSAPRAKLSCSLDLNNGVINSETSTYSGNDRSTIKVNQPL
ncbi:hypothetical protein D3C84_871390 [compost metagenome]